MKTSCYTPFWLFSGLMLSIGLMQPVERAAAADNITGTYKFEGTAKARDTADGSTKSKKFTGTMRVARRSVKLQIPISVNGRVVKCNRKVKAKLNKALKKSPTRASARATFLNHACKGSNWFGTLRLRWFEHPEGYSLSFTLAGINDETDAEKITGKFTGSTGTLSTEENAPPLPEVPETPEPPAP